jgi:hypothetical protein
MLTQEPLDSYLDKQDRENEEYCNRPDERISLYTDEEIRWDLISLPESCRCYSCEGRGWKVYVENHEIIDMEPCGMCKQTGKQYPADDSEYAVW